MSRRNLLIPFLLWFSFQANSCSAQHEQNYLRYHRLINQAEETFFLRGNYDSAKAIYTRVFDDYDFSFLRDCLVAAQIAAVQKDWPACIRFLSEGFDNGLRPGDMTHIHCYFCGVQNMPYVQVFDTLCNDQQTRRLLQGLYVTGHKKYLSGIDTGLRLYIDSIFLEEELTKNNQTEIPPAGPDYFFHEGRWDHLYDSLVRSIGYPGERLIGVDDSSLVEELGYPELTMRPRYLKRISGHDEADFHIQFSIVDQNDGDFSAKNPLIPALHHSCLYEVLYPFAMIQIANGNLHPREFAAMVDQFAGGTSKNQKCQYEKWQQCFVYRKSDNESIPASADENRRKLYIVSTAVDAAKRKYQREHHVSMFFGFSFSL